MKYPHLKQADPEIYRLLMAEIERQANTLDLIPSENIAPLAVLEALGSPLVNKYTEGYPGERYYPGCRIYDEIDVLCNTRALAAFKLDSEQWHVNNQALAGAQANFAIYKALVKPGEKIMGMKLRSGGHLSHGHKASYTGQDWQAIQYDVDPQTNRLDYKEIERLALEHKPKLIISGFTAYPRRVDFKEFGRIADLVGAYHLADVSHIAGLILAGWHLTPFPYTDAVMMTTHKTLRGPRGALIFCKKELAEKIDRAVFPGMQGGPFNNVHAAIAAMFKAAANPEYRRYQKKVIENAGALAEALKDLGFKLITDGTDTHLMLIDVRNFNLDGVTAERLLEEVGIIANKNSIPYDEKPPTITSGVRVGTPSVTSRGMEEKEMKVIAELIHWALTKSREVDEIKEAVQNLCRRFPLPY